MEAVSIHFLIQGEVDPDDARGAFQCPVSGASPRLRDLRASFPFEGEFAFRAKWAPPGSGEFVWVDLADDAEELPLWEDGCVYVKALFVDAEALEERSTFEVEPDAPPDLVYAPPAKPVAGLRCSWTEILSSRAAGHAAVAGTRHESAGAAETGDEGVAASGGYSAVLTETAGKVGKRLGSFLSSTVKVATSYFSSDTQGEPKRRQGNSKRRK